MSWMGWPVRQFLVQPGASQSSSGDPNHTNLWQILINLTNEPLNEQLSTGVCQTNLKYASMSFTKCFNWHALQQLVEEYVKNLAISLQEIVEIVRILASCCWPICEEMCRNWVSSCSDILSLRIVAGLAIRIQNVCPRVPFGAGNFFILAAIWHHAFVHRLVDQLS